MLKKRIKFLQGQEKEQKHNMASRVEASLLLSFLSATRSGSQQSGSFWVKRDLKWSMRQEPGIKLCSKPGDGQEKEAGKNIQMQTTIRGQYVWESAGSRRLESKEPIKLPPPPPHQLCGQIEISPISPQSRNHHSAPGPQEARWKKSQPLDRRVHRGITSDKKTPSPIKSQPLNLNSKAHESI